MLIIKSPAMNAGYKSNVGAVTNRQYQQQRWKRFKLVL
jgi:hypothetical protein